MTPFQPLLIAVACALALSACASAPPVSRTSVPPPTATAGLDQLAATGGTAYGAANTGGTYPYGTIQTAASDTTQQAATGAGDGIVVMSPEGAVWIRSGAPDPRYQSDIDSCYAYAHGQVAHDVRIESDVSAAFQSEAGGLGLAALRGRMNNFERNRRVPSLFSNCMVAKGYSGQ